MKWFGLIASSFIFVSLACSSSAQTTAARTTEEEGLKLFHQGRFEQALIMFKEAHRIAPGNATIENLLGITETELGHVDEACKHYRDAIRLDPSQAAPHRNLGFNLLNQKDYADAEPELHEASRLDPTDTFAHYYLVLVALATGRDTDAMDQASRAGDLLDNEPETSARLIEAEIRIGRVDAASTLIERMEKANQLSAAEEYSIAASLSRNGHTHESAHCFRRITLLDPSWESRYNLALALLYDGQYVEASTQLAALHTERPASADTLMFLGSAFELQNKMPEALKAYQAAFAADPSNPDRMLDYTRLLMDTDRYDEAIQAVQTGIGVSYAKAPLQLRLGAVEMLKANYPAAREAFQEALAADPQLDAAYVGLAQTYARQANDAEAIRILEAARTKRPDSYSLEYYFGLLASRLGREQEAITALERAGQLEPKSFDPFYELGKLYMSQQDWPRARQALEYVVGLNPKFQPAHYQLSHVYGHLGLKAKAAEEEQRTRMLVDSQRDEAVRKQRERAVSFQPNTSEAPSPQP
jgi:tetratricopeptide (TPR) repeat protein